MEREPTRLVIGKWEGLERAHVARDREVGRFGEELQGEHYIKNLF